MGEEEDKQEEKSEANSEVKAEEAKVKQQLKDMRKLPVFKDSDLDPITSPLSDLIAKEKSLKKANGGKVDNDGTVAIPEGLTGKAKETWIKNKLKSMRDLPLFKDKGIDPLTEPMDKLISREKKVKTAMKEGPDGISKLSENRRGESGGNSE